MTLAQQRGGHKAQIKCLTDQANYQLSLESLSRDSLASIRNNLNRHKEIICTLDEKILETLEEDADVNEQIADSSDFIVKVDATIIKITRTLDNLFLQDRGADQPLINNTSTNVKLPFIKLMTFTGDSLQWQKFWDLFRSSIHERTDLSGATKFHYLVSQLGGEAEQLLAGFDHTDGEYTEAVDLLKETYGKPQRLIQARLHAIFDLENPSSNSNELGKFRSLYEGHLRGLKSLGANVDAAGYVFAELLIRKLPSKVRDNLNRSQKSDFWTLVDLRREIDIEIGHLQSVQPKYSDDFPNLPTASFRTTTNYTPKCHLCSYDHFVNNCPKYKTLESKRNRVNELKLCFNCLRGKHVARKCNNSGRCRNCNSRHHTSLCNGNVAKSQTNSAVKENVSEIPTNAMTALNNCHSNILPTANLSIIQNVKITKVKAILDTGSQRTFILKRIVKSLNLPIVDKVSMTIDGFNSQGISRNYDVTNFNITTSDGILNIMAVVIDVLPSRINMHGRSEIVESLQSKGLILADPTSGDKISNLGMIIGVDFFFKLLGSSKIENDLYGIPSRVGTIIGGSIGNSESISCNQITVLRLDIFKTNSLDDKLQRFWEMDSIDVNKQDNDVLSEFEKTISFEDGKYSVGLPWKTNSPTLPRNYYYAKSRLNSNMSKLRENLEDLKYYNEVIEGQLKAGFIEDVTDVHSSSDRVHYLAHRGIKKDSMTTPLRVVYDCSAKIRGNPSLNDCLYSGPNLINDLCDILLRFRVGSFAATSDIKKAFLNVRLNSVDRDCTRFLWPENPFREGSPLKTYRFCSVLFGSTASPFLLNATLRFHLGKVNTELSREMGDNVYIDNLYIASNCEKDLSTKKLSCTNILNDAGFSLHDWFSNSSLVSDKSMGKDSCCNVLGVVWNVGRDTLSIAPVDLKRPDVFTKREIVSHIASVFDPLGFLLPVTIKGRIIIQDIWKAKIDWDQKVPSNIEQTMLQYYCDVENCLSLQFDRCLTSLFVGNLHVFADASTRAYGSVAYFCSSKTVDFLLSKSKIAPIASKTLPELELSAVLLSVQLANYIIKTMKNKIKFNEIFIWSDSSITLHWLNSNKVKRQFVRNRVEKIKELSENFLFKYINTTDNPGDLITRGLSSKMFFSKLSLWLHGPTWLKSNTWPATPFNLSCGNACNICIESVEVVNVSSDTCTNKTEGNLTFVEKYSSYSKLLRVTSYINRFVSNCRRESDDRMLGTLSVDEINSAEIIILSYVQRKFYPEIFDYFNKTCTNSKPSSLIRNLRLFIDEGILRCGGRIHNSDVEMSAKFPILLPPKSYVTKLIIWDLHNKFHFGVNYTISNLRQKFWLPKARQNIKSILFNCIKCKKLQGRPFIRADTPPLPKIRVTESLPFSVTCVDYTGAITIKDNSNFVKYYVCLFTCAVTRAVHLELVENLGADAFIRSLQRFAGRRSYPSFLISDNATNFTNSNDILTEILNSKIVNDYFLDHKIIWKFITPSAPWMGGVYERLIGVFKQCLKKIVGKASLTFHELNTIVVQIEGAMNDRPLTYASNNLDELQPLTPSMLLCGHRIFNLPVSIDYEELFDPSYNSKEILTKRFKFCTKLIRDFFVRWKNEYLLALRETDRNIKCSNSNLNLKIGKIVLIHEDCNRLLWKMGIIVKLHVGSDGIVRSVDVKTKNGILTRPVIKLYPLELDVDYDNSLTSDIVENVIRNKSTREAAIEANRKIKTLHNC